MDNTPSSSWLRWIGSETPGFTRWSALGCCHGFLFPSYVASTVLSSNAEPIGFIVVQVRRKELPPEFWEARRLAKNKRRAARDTARRKRHTVAQRQAEDAALIGMTSDEERVAREARRVAEEEAEALQAARVDAAMESGPFVVVECSLAAGSSPREVRSLAKQLQLAAGANRRAAAPLGLCFAGFKGKYGLLCFEG
jgi:hypothetical protein